MAGAELGTGAIGGTIGYQTAEDDAPITSKLGRFGIGFLAGAGGIKATKKISKTTKVKKTFGKSYKDISDDKLDEVFVHIEYLLEKPN